MSHAQRSRGNLYVCVSANGFLHHSAVLSFFSSEQCELNWGGSSVARVEEANGQGDGIWMQRQWGLFVWEEEAAGGQQGTTGDI